MQVIVQVEAELISGLAGATDDDDRLAPIRTAAQGRLQPLHPGVNDPELGSFFVLDVRDAASAARAIERLRSLDGIQAAYAKPADEMP